MTSYERHNARISDPVNLRARFFKAQQFFDPYRIDRVEIWKHSEDESKGGVLVDTVDGDNIIQDDPGHYRLIYDPFTGCEGSPVSPNPPGTVVGPGSPGQDPNDPALIEANAMYFDKWYYQPDPNCPITSTVGLKFYLYPNEMFVDSGFDRFRFEVKPDRTMLVRSEILDVRLRVIPIPLYVANRDPITNYLIPLNRVEYKWTDTRNEEIEAWQDAIYTGKEAIIPTKSIATNIPGAYMLSVRMHLPNGQMIAYPKMPFQVRA